MPFLIPQTMNFISKITSLLFFAFLSHGPVLCQGFLKNTFVTGGIALSGQDRRLFYFHHPEEFIEGEKSKVDYEYNLLLQKNIFTYKRFQANIGAGYSEHNSTFPRPFDFSVLGGGLTRELRVIKRYTINKLIMPVSGSIFLSSSKKISLNFTVVPAVSFRKSAKDVVKEKRETKWELEWNGLELYPGLGMRINKRMCLTANYRLYYIYKLDEVIFNHILFYQINPEFLNKKYDTYNPFKIWVTVGYRLNE